MADDKQPGTNLASGSVIFVALLATGTYLFHRDAPLVGSRPAMTEASISERAAPQTIDARLWQDPFAAVTKTIDKLGKSERGQQCLNSDDKTCNSPLDSESGEETLVIGVTVSGAPYSEDAEQRRRTRYAVLAGLERAGFVPRDARHIGYFWLPQQHKTSASLRPALSHLLQIYPNWSDSNRLSATTLMLRPLPFPLSPLVESPDRNKLAATAPTGQPPLFALSSLLQFYEQGPDRLAATIAPAQFPSVPYEWFDEAPRQSFPPMSQTPQPKSILLLWLEEESLKNRPLQKIYELKTFLNVQGNQKLKIIGPYTSDILHDMVLEACPFIVDMDKKNKCEPAPTQADLSHLDVPFYAYGASAPDSKLLGKWYVNYRTVESYFDKFHLLRRTIANDDTLAHGIVSELKLRNAKVGPGKNDGDLALVSEWDTFYGQTLPKAVERQFSLGRSRPGWQPSRTGHDASWIHKLTYLRGLDGLSPMTEGTEDRKQDKAATQGEKQAGAAGFFKTQTDAKNLDRPVGQGQFDYLRRMSKDLHKTDEELRKKGRRLKVIGVLGSDVFDKLLVLRALRPEFPEALFFTTDFDEAFTIESELPWTRNLIISSSFGPKLNDEIQGEIPSFRSSYQTAAFLATLSAIGDPDHNWETPDGFSDYIAGQLSTPRIFEISRSGDARALSTDAVTTPSPMYFDGRQKECSKDSGSCNPLLLVAEAAVAVGRSAAEVKAQRSNKEPLSCTGENASNCGNIQPANEPLFPTFDDTGRKLLAAGLAGGAFLGLGLLYLRKVPKGARVEVRLGVACLSVGALTCVFWEPFAQFVTRHGQGEPIAMLEGVSVWPTVLLRILGIILSIYFIWRERQSSQESCRYC